MAKPYSQDLRQKVIAAIEIETCLIKCLKPGQWLVIDRATFDRGGRIEQLIEQAGCHLLDSTTLFSRFQQD